MRSASRGARLDRNSALPASDDAHGFVDKSEWPRAQKGPAERQIGVPGMRRIVGFSQGLQALRGKFFGHGKS
jgi:hypothetical protein